MEIVYTAPNRAHHYKYAFSLNQKGVLNTFVSGFSRFSPRASFPEIGNKLHRADILQTVYLAGMKLGLPSKLNTQLAYLAKIEQDHACLNFAKKSDVFLFYNGSGLDTCGTIQKLGKIGIVEVVNSHVETQEKLLQDEHELVGADWVPFHAKEKERRIKEYDLADYILLPSEFAKKSFLDKGYPEAKLIKVPYGFDTSIVGNQEQFEKNSDRFNVLYVGSISLRKGLRYLIQAFKELKHPNKKLIIVGPGQESLKKMKDLSIPDEVTFTGVLKGEQLQEVYKSASVFCLPTIEDGFGLVLGEALSHGIPIIATENSGSWDIVAEGSDGFIIPIRNKNIILEKLQLLADDRNLLLEMSHNAQTKAKNLKGWDITSDTLYSSLKKVTSNKS
jgi:starch synthase